MNVHDLARRAGVPDHVVRYYTQRGFLDPRRNSRNGYREYASSDLHRLRFICRAKLVGFSLSDIDKILRNADSGVAPCAQVQQLVRKRAEDNDRRLATVKRLQTRIRAVVEFWEATPNEPPNHESLCRLIDALALVEVDEEELLVQYGPAPDAPVE